MRSSWSPLASGTETEAGGALSAEGFVGNGAQVDIDDDVEDRP